LSDSVFIPFNTHQSIAYIQAKVLL